MIIPAFNSSDTICRSISSALAQKDVEVEIIIIDDGTPNDSVKEKVSEFRDPRIKYLWQNNAGPSTARNKGVSLADGELIAFLDSDDEWLPHKLAHQSQFMARNNLSSCVTEVIQYNSDGQGDRYRKPDLKNNNKNEIVKLIYKEKITRNTPTLLTKKEIFNAVGGFDEDLKNKEDHHLLCKLAFQNGFAVQQEALTKRHVIKNSYSRNYKPLKYYQDTLLFHKKMHEQFPFLPIRQGIRRTKWAATKLALRSHAIKTALIIIIDQKWRKIFNQ